MTNYLESVNRLRAKWGADRFRENGLAQKFRPYCNTGERIKVRFWGDEIKTGFVGMTGGWKPVLILLLRTDSSGSAWTLHDDDELLAIQRNGRYVPVTKEV